MNTYQDIDMQISRLTKLLDQIYEGCYSHLGVGNNTTHNALKAVAYLEGLRFDLAVTYKTDAVD